MTIRIPVAQSHAEMYNLALQFGLAKTAKGGWFLIIGPTRRFMLVRYRHIMLVGHLDTHEVYFLYPDMKRTDIDGVRRFMEHFGFPPLRIPAKDDS